MYTQNDVTLLMVNWNQRPVMELALKSYIRHHHRGDPLKIGLVDNGSDDDSKSWLTENGIPFIDFQLNVGHENALNILYNELRTRFMLISDTDIEFMENFYDKYMPVINERCKLVGDFITNDQLGTAVKPRVGAWTMFSDALALKNKGVRVFRKTDNWAYDVGSEYTENVLLNGFEIYHTPRLNADINRDVVGMDYGSHHHFGKMSWNLKNHADRESEVQMRMKYIIEERLPLYEDIKLKDKFIGI